MSRPGVLILVWGLLIAPSRFLGADENSSVRAVVLVAHLDDQTINPITARFLERAIGEARNVRAECLILVIDTPGGLVSSTRTIVQEMLASEVPVVVYVAPSGARAASAGVFITIAGHVAAMAPGTHIGAAYPVQIGELPASRTKESPEGQPQSAKEEKIVSDTVAWARALAELRGRNADWAAQAVRESVSVPASEALHRGVIDLIATDEQDLLRQLHGRTLTLHASEVRLDTAKAEMLTLEMGRGERFLSALSNPTLAFLLLMIGFYGVIFELYSPGWGVAGTLGVICLLLGFMALSVLPVNYVGLALLLVAIGLFVAEAFVTSYGLLAFAGSVCLVLGGLLLVDSPAGFQRVSLTVLVPVAVASAAITIFLLSTVVRTHRRAIQTGEEALANWEGTADEEFTRVQDHYEGFVRARGELWKAKSREAVARSQSVRIESRDDLTLLVRPVNGDTAKTAFRDNQHQSQA